MYLTEVPTSYAHVSGILDSLATSGARTINWRKPIYSAIDEMRTRAAPQAQIDAAERISIALHGNPKVVGGVEIGGER